MTAKKYLQQVRTADAMIQKKQAMLDRLRDGSTSISCPTDAERVSHSTEGDQIGKAVASIIDLNREIETDIDNFVDMKADVMHTVDKIESIDEKVLLYCRYFEYKTFEQCAAELHISMRTVYRLHKKSLDSVQKERKCQCMTV